MRNSRLVDSSLAVIMSLQEKSGGFTATMADDAYPYVYPRDAVFMTMALNACAEFERSKRFYRFLTDLRRPAGEFYQRYNAGLPYVTNEHELDTTPIVLQGIHDTYSKSGDVAFLREMWSLVEECSAFTLRSIDGQAGLVYTTNAIHENRELEEGFEIWTNCAAARGLLDASRMAEAVGLPNLQEEWLGRARALFARIAEKLYDAEAGAFVKVMRRSGELVKAADMSVLAPFYFGLSDDNKILESTLGRLRSSLWNKEIGGFNRFQDFEVVHDWHWYTGGTGASWPFFTIWAARFYNQIGSSEDEEACYDFLDSVVTSDLFIPEKVAPLKGYNLWKENELEFGDRVLNGVRKIERGVHSIRSPDYVCWACPLGWAHAEYILMEKGVRPDAASLLGEVPSAPTIKAA